MREAHWIMNSSEMNMAAVREFTRTFKNEHNVDGIDHLFAGNFAHHFAPPVKPGLEGFKDIGRMMNHAFPDVVVTEEDLIANETTVVERSSAVGTHKGDFMGTPATGRKIRWTEIHIYRFDGGKIVGHWVEISMLQLLQQIGAVPVPAVR
jgi:predicted ester cyclase